MTRTQHGRAVAEAALVLVRSARGDVWATVAAAHATAVLLLVPTVVRTPAPPPSAARTERVALWAALLVSAAAVFGTDLLVPLTFVPAAVLVWAGLWLGVATAAAQLLVVGVVVALFTAAGRGPLAALALLPQPGGPVVTEVLVQVFLACCMLVVLALAVTAAQREDALAALAAQRLAAGARWPASTSTATSCASPRRTGRSTRSW